MLDLKGKTAFVTGAASGIGLALTRAFLEEGMNVVLADIETPALERALAELSAFGNRTRGLVCDTAVRASVQSAAKEAYAAFGRVHVVCNNAGVGGGGPLDTILPEQWAWVLGVNLMGVVHGIAEFLPHIRAHGEGGHFINTASMAGMRGNALMGPYCASKSAVVSITETLAAELSGSNIGASVLCPGWVRTRIQDSRRNQPDPLKVLAPTAAPLPVVAQRMTEVRALIDNGMSPEEVAARVLAAIRDGDLYVFTHPEARTGTEERFQRISAAFDKAERFTAAPEQARSPS